MKKRLSSLFLIPAVLFTLLALSAFTQLPTTQVAHASPVTPQLPHPIAVTCAQIGMEIGNEQRGIQQLQDAGASPSDLNLQVHENQLAQLEQEYNSACGSDGSNGSNNGWLRNL